MPFELGISTFRSDRPGIRKVLGDLEAEIMELIWAQPSEKGIAVRHIFELSINDDGLPISKNLFQVLLVIFLKSFS